MHHARRRDSRVLKEVRVEDLRVDTRVASQGSRGVGLYVRNAATIESHHHTPQLQQYSQHDWLRLDLPINRAVFQDPRRLTRGTSSTPFPSRIELINTPIHHDITTKSLTPTTSLTPTDEMQQSNLVYIYSLTHPR